MTTGTYGFIATTDDPCLFTLIPSFHCFPLPSTQFTALYCTHITTILSLTRLSIVAATDTNYPWTNQFQLDESEVDYWQEVSDSRFMVVCFVEPLFNVKHPFL